MDIDKHNICHGGETGLPQASLRKKWCMGLPRIWVSLADSGHLRWPFALGTNTSVCSHKLDQRFHVFDRGLYIWTIAQSPSKLTRCFGDSVRSKEVLYLYWFSDGNIYVNITSVTRFKLAWFFTEHRVNTKHMMVTALVAGYKISKCSWNMEPNDTTIITKLAGLFTLWIDIEKHVHRWMQYKCSRGSAYVPYAWRERWYLWRSWVELPLLASQSPPT